MSWNGTGTFNRLFSWVADAAAGIDISSTRTDADTNDITANGLGNSLTRDGQGQPTANLPMANFRHTGASNGVAVSDYATIGQLQSVTGVNWAVAGGTGDALTAVYSPALATLVDGQLCYVRATAVNTIGAPTFAPNGLTPQIITKLGGVNLGIGEIKGSLHELIFRYNLANTRWEWINPSNLIEAQTGTASLGIPVVAGAGINYAIGDSVTLAGGTFIRAAVVQVATLSGSGISTITVLDAGLYTVFPTSPVSQGSTSGLGSGATFTLTSTPASLLTNFANSRLFQIMGMSAFMDGLMKYTTGVDLVTGIGAANVAAAVGLSAPPAGASFKNMAIKVTGNTGLTAAADFIVTTNGTKYQTTALASTLNMSTTGANALDTGSIAAATWYAIWAIAKPDGTTAALASLSATAPTMPSGYTYKARIGWVRTASGSAQLLGSWQLGRRAQYIVGLAQTASLPIIIGGAQGSVTVPTWFAQSISNFVPPTASEIAMVLNLHSPANNATIVAPNNSYGNLASTTNPPPLSYICTSSATGGTSIPATFLLESTNIYYASETSAAAELFCQGWTDNL